MIKLTCTVLVFGSISISAAAEPLPRSSPEAQGISSRAIEAFAREANQHTERMHSFIIVRHGHVVAQAWWSPYHARGPHALYSLSKSFTATAVGLAVAEGKLSVDDLVLKFFPDDAPNKPAKNLEEMRVSDLLRMATGHDTEPELTSETPWTTTFLAHPVPHKPGTHFLYDPSATYMLSAIVQKVTGKTLLDYLGPRLFEPLGILPPPPGKLAHRGSRSAGRSEPPHRGNRPVRPASLAARAMERQAALACRLG